MLPLDHLQRGLDIGEEGHRVFYSEIPSGARDHYLL
jgi:hypothetical protein